MSTSNQLEVIRPDGQIEFHDLSAGTGVLRIGRDPENDVIISSPAVAPFHALLDYRQTPCKFVNLSQQTISVSGQPIAPNASSPVNTWDVIELDKYSLILVDGTDISQTPNAAPQAVQASTPTTASIPVPPVTPTTPNIPASKPHKAHDELLPERQDDIILTEFSQYDLTTEIQQPASFQVTITNGGSLVANFGLKVEVLDPAWVTITPLQVNLAEGQQATINITITPPRAPTSTAGAHHFAVMVYSPEHLQRVSRTHATLHINPYFEFSAGAISPQTQKIPWAGHKGTAIFTITNRSNAEVPFQLHAKDDEGGCQFGFREPGGATSRPDTTIRVPAHETRKVEITIRPHKRRFIGAGRKYYSFAVAATPLAEQARQTPLLARARVYTTALLSPWLVALIALMALGLCALVALGVAQLADLI